jgi:glycosyltransferase involved in cell wall biosynthesis
MPLVSIIIPAYNAAHFLDDSLGSCLAQTHKDLEIIVVNDGSNDDTPAVLARYPQVRHIYQPNGGLAAARNTGIQHAQGEFIQFLDADDVLLPTKIARCLEVFAADPTLGLVYTDFEIRNADLSAPVPEAEKPPIYMREENLLEQLVNTTSTLFRVPCPLIRTEHVRAVGGFIKGMQGVEDWNFWIRLAAMGVRFYCLDEVLVWYRHSPASMSKSLILMNRSRLAAVQHLRTLNLPAHLDIEGKIAWRHHNLALVLWAEGQRAEARQHLWQALRLQKTSRAARLWLWGASFFLSAHRADALLQSVLSLRRR